MSRLALQLIAKEKRARTGKLDLGKCGLSSLPFELFELVWLEELILSNSFIESDENGFKKDYWEESINKGQRNELSEIPVGMKRLRNLEKLIIAGNPHHIWKIKKLENLPKNLYNLDISYNRIEQIAGLPSEIGILNLSHNRIEKLAALPDNLITFDSSHNHIQQLQNLPAEYDQR